MTAQNIINVSFFLSLIVAGFLFVFYWIISFHKGSSTKSIRLRKALLRATNGNNHLLVNVDYTYRTIVAKSWVKREDKSITLHIPIRNFWQQVDDRTYNNILTAVKSIPFQNFLHDAFPEYSFSAPQHTAKFIYISGSKN
ncbi:hypothetical protein [Fructobacillus fructosus]|uniref:hypothetical protein n=1 Tax=Fructobacillus fructosus TaxID=1631 RepID=UPI00200B0E39|nr:hypothetical protein [Fructobacillus fructosus]MCK8638994.1 hypothetical protein [Fructobacillus fructosus]